MNSEMMDIVLEWVDHEPPPTEKYMAVAHFLNVPAEQPGTVWSIVLHAPPGGFTARGAARASMLVPEASGHLLVAGAQFEVMAGRRKVACGRVVGASRSPRN